MGEKVTVEAQVPQVETEQGRVTGHIDTQQLKELPLNGRNLYSLLALQPGVSGRGLAATFGAGGGGSNNDSFAAVNGPKSTPQDSASESNSYSLDDSSVNSAARGGVANLTPNPDSVAEVRVVSNNFSAVNGRSSSASRRNAPFHRTLPAPGVSTFGSHLPWNRPPGLFQSCRQALPVAQVS